MESRLSCRYQVTLSSASIRCRFFCLLGDMDAATINHRCSEGPPPPLLGARILMAFLIQTLTVAECLNFRHAANALGISQSCVSAQTRALEEELVV